MSEKELARWLMDLAACYNHVPQRSAIAAEIREEAELRASTEYLAGKRKEWQREDDVAPEVLQRGEA